MEIFIWAIMLGLIPALVAKNKGKSFPLWWLYGAAIFIVALPHSLIIRTDAAQVEKQQLAEGMKKCRHCAEMVKGDAVICKHCKRKPE